MTSTPPTTGDQPTNHQLLDAVPTQSPAELQQRERDRRAALAAAEWRRVRGAMLLFVAMLAISVAAVIYVRITGRTDPMVEAAAIGAFAVIVTAVAIPKHSLLLPLLRWPQPAGSTALLSLVTLLALGVVLETWFWVIGGWIEIHRMMEPFETHGWPLWSAFVLISLLPAITEEIAFRGLIMNGLSGVLRSREVLAVQAILFGVAHCSLAILPSHVAIGFALGWLRWRTDSLLPGIAVHAAWNAFVLVSEIW